MPGYHFFDESSFNVLSEIPQAGKANSYFTLVSVIIKYRIFSRVEGDHCEQATK